MSAVVGSRLIIKEKVLNKLYIQGLGYLALASLLLSGCASTQGPANGRPVAAIEVAEPDDVNIGSPQSDLMYQIMLAEIASQRGLNEVALKYYMSALRQAPSARIASRVVRIASFMDANKEAMEAARIWAKEEPDNLEASRILAVLYLRNDEFSAATAELHKILNTDKDQFDRAILHVGQILRREIPNEQAFQIASQLVESHPESPEGQYIVALLALDAQHDDEALARIDQALELERNWVDAVTLRARILQSRGEKNAALTYLKKYLAKNPKEHSVRLIYARALVDAQKLEEARNQFELLAVKMPDNQDVLFALAILSLQFKAYDEAEGYLMQLDRLGKRSPQLVYYLGQIAEQKKDWDAALDWYAQVGRGEFFLDAQVRIAAVLSQNKGLKEAIRHLEALELENQDDQREVMLFQAGLLKDNRKYSKALKLLNRIMDKYGRDTELLYDRALLLERMGKVDDALRDLRFVVSEQPDNPSALNALGYTLADRTKNYDEALIYVRKAIELEPNDPAIMDSMGWVNYRLGNSEVALEYLQKAMEQVFDGEIAAHLGEVLWSLGRQDEAIKIWKKAQEKFSDNETLNETIGRFTQ